MERQTEKNPSNIYSSFLDVQESLILRFPSVSINSTVGFFWFFKAFSAAVNTWAKGTRSIVGIFIGYNDGTSKRGQNVPFHKPLIPLRKWRK